jgi:hypothetical protein
VVNETRDEKTNKVTISVGPPIIFSDRPQYIGQIQSGEVFYSTKPTPARCPGHHPLHRSEAGIPGSAARAAVPRRAGRAGPTISSSTPTPYSSVRALVSTAAPDTLVLYDHPPGTIMPSDSAVSTVGVGAAVAALRALNGSDVSFVQGADVSALGLTDTTFVATSGDRRWVAFGEGNTSNGRIVMASKGFFSPVISQLDLTANTAERVNGLALDLTGATMAAHGIESYFTAVDLPFHLRLQGKYTSNASGAGIVFHPQANGVTSFDQNANGIHLVGKSYRRNRRHLPLHQSWAPGAQEQPVRSTPCELAAPGGPAGYHPQTVRPDRRKDWSSSICEPTIFLRCPDRLEGATQRSRVERRATIG